MTRAPYVAPRHVSRVHDCDRSDARHNNAPDRSRRSATVLGRRTRGRARNRQAHASQQAIHRSAPQVSSVPIPSRVDDVVRLEGDHGARACSCKRVGQVGDPAIIVRAHIALAFAHSSNAGPDQALAVARANVRTRTGADRLGGGGNHDEVRRHPPCRRGQRVPTSAPRAPLPATHTPFMICSAFRRGSAWSTGT